MVGASRVLAKLVAASLDSMARMSSLPPARFLALEGTMNGSPAALRSASHGSFELAVTVGSGMPFIWKPCLVAFFISFSIQEPDGYRIACWSLLHFACAAVNWVPAPPGM